MRAHPSLRAVALLASIVLVSCTGSSPTKPSPSTIPSQPQEHVGQVVIGATQWPECLNPITSCALSDWTWYTVLQHVVPRAMEIGPDGRYRASPLLAVAPSVANGGLS